MAVIESPNFVDASTFDACWNALGSHSVEFHFD